MADSVTDIFEKYYKKKLEFAMKKYDPTFVWEDDKTFKSEDAEAYLKEVGGAGPQLINQEIQVKSYVQVKGGHRRRVSPTTRKAPAQSLEKQLEDVRVATPFMERAAAEAFNMVVEDNAFKKEIEECFNREQRR